MLVEISDGLVAMIDNHNTKHHLGKDTERKNNSAVYIAAAMIGVIKTKRFYLENDINYLPELKP